MMTHRPQGQRPHGPHAASSAPVDFLTWLSEMAASTEFVNLNPSVKDTTHYRMDGGKLCISPLLMDEFLAQYAAALDRGEVLSVVERRTDIYKMHYDLDVLDHQPWSEAVITQTLQEVRTAMAECFPPDKAAALFRTVVLTAPPKQVNGMWKTGVHVIYPDLEVDSAMGLTLRKVAVMRLNRLQRRLAPLNSWDDVLDRCVHVANGLRMVGSVKMSKCGQCIAKRKRLKNVGFDKFVLCDDCRGKTMCNDGRAYTACLLLDGLGNKDVEGTEELKQNRLICVTLSSIRYFKPVGMCRNPFFVLPPGISLEDPGAVKATGKGATLVVSRKDFRNKDKKQSVQGNSQLVPVLEAFLTSNPLMSQLGWTCADNPYQHMSVVKVTYTKVNFLVNVEGPGSTYCNNKNGNHNSSKIYFDVRSKHLVQRCFCAKAPIGDGEPCKEYKSRPVKLPEDLRKLLFPAAPAPALSASVDEIRQNVSQNMEGCAVVHRAPTKQQEKQVFVQRSWQQYLKRVDILKQFSITTPMEAVPWSKETSYPSSVSSQLCRFKTAEVDQFTAAQLCNMTEAVVEDLGSKTKEASKTKPRKRKRDDAE